MENQLKEIPDLTGHFHVFIIDKDNNQLSKCGVGSPTTEMIYELIHQSIEDGYDGIIFKKVDDKLSQLEQYLQSKEGKEGIQNALNDAKKSINKLNEDRRIDWNMLNEPITI